MKEIVSKFSLYDILAMVIPGGTILIAFALILDNLLTINTTLVEKTLFWIIGLVVSYIIGLLNHIMTAAVWRKFRNNEFMINLSIHNAKSCLPSNGHFNRLTSTVDISNIDKSRIKHLGRLALSVLWVYIIIIVLLIMAYFACNKCCDSNFSLLITIPLISILICVMVEFAHVFSYKGISCNVILKYYSAYYYTIKNKYSDDISIMEGQIAFLQSMILPLLLFFLMITKCYT